MMTFDLFYLLLSIVFAGQVNADRSDSEKEEQPAKEEEDDAGDPNGFRFERRTAPDHQKQADNEDKAGQTAAEQTEIEVSTRSLLVQVSMTLIGCAAASSTAARSHQIATTTEAAAQHTSGVARVRVTDRRHRGHGDDDEAGGGGPM
jgi:hypothetical protein